MAVEEETAPSALRTLPEGDGRIPSLNLLRGLAALSVLAFHNLRHIEVPYLPAWDTVLEKGHLGLDLFFLISGFVIPYSMYMNGYSIRRFHRYLLKRGCRIEIPYIASFLLLIIVRIIYAKVQGGSYTIDRSQFLLHFLYLNKYFDSEFYIAVYWTLVIEFQFYLLIGLLYPLLMHPRRAVPLALLAIWSAVCLWVYAPYEKWIIQFGMHFQAGVLLFLYMVGHIRALPFGLLLVATLVMMYFANGLDVMLTILFGIAVILTLKRRWKLTEYLGTISFSLYLVHIDASGFLWVSIKNCGYPPWVVYPSLFVFTFFVATLFYLLIERPSLRLSKRIRYGPRKAVGAVP